jgi:Domain of unknown function (DUF4282)
MSNDPSSGDQPGWQGQQPYPGYGQQRGEQPAYGASAYPPPAQQGYGQAAPPWSQPGGQPGGGYPGGTPGGYPGPAGLGHGGGLPTADANTFFSALFDFSFKSFATPVITRVMYILGLVGIILGYIAYVIFWFTINGGAGIVALLVGAVVVLFLIMSLRLALEFNFAVVQMTEDVRALRNRP